MEEHWLESINWLTVSTRYNSSLVLKTSEIIENSEVLGRGSSFVKYSKEVVILCEDSKEEGEEAVIHRHRHRERERERERGKMSSYEAVTEKPVTATKWVVTCMVGGVIVGVSLLGAYSSQLGMFWKSRRRNKKPVRVYMDGCFDMMHYGHCNALRQARALGDQLIVGVVSDAEIIANKGGDFGIVLNAIYLFLYFWDPVPQMSAIFLRGNLLDGPLPEALDVERNVRGPFFKTLVKVFTVDCLIDASYYSRLVMVNAVKWVDEVIPEAPYAITEEFMKKLFDEYKIDFIIHGDDPCVLPDGTDAYAHAKKAGRYKQIKRTEGVSSTDIVDLTLSLDCFPYSALFHGLWLCPPNVMKPLGHSHGRMLLCVRERSISDSHNHSSLQRQFSNGHSPKFEPGSPAATASGTRISHFLPTSRRIVQFSNGRGPGPDSRIVYIDGAFDLFHAGHVEILRLARDLGDFLLVGIHTDQTVRLCHLNDVSRLENFVQSSISWGPDILDDWGLNFSHWVAITL
ncbi:hypothetical protein V8G54_021401 [Vigna mungo]|uniref:ethanolamine-phosphate cytidylyltransferase n=1 Tax=Vigna mungo TaxID=3915 RepID=A0AAQ3NDA5_VIGMU